MKQVLCLAALVWLPVAFASCNRGGDTAMVESAPVGDELAEAVKDADTWWVSDGSKEAEPERITATDDGTAKKEVDDAAIQYDPDDPFRTAGLYVENNSSVDLRIVVTGYWNGTYYTGGTLPKGYSHEYRFPWGNFSAVATGSNGRKATKSGHVSNGRRDAWYINDAALK